MKQPPFKIWFLPLLLLLLCLGMVGGWLGYQAWFSPAHSNNSYNYNQPTPTPTATPTPASSATPTPDSTPTTQQVKLYFVAIGETSEDSFGCGDNLQAVNKTITSNAPLTETLKQLLSLKEQYYGQSGLYNALYQSDITVQSVTITQGAADIKLVGQLKLGGTCDAPRVEEQLTATARQFTSVTSANISLNGKPLSEALSSR